MGFHLTFSSQVTIQINFRLQHVLFIFLLSTEGCIIVRIIRSVRYSVMYSLKVFTNIGHMVFSLIWPYDMFFFFFLRGIAPHGTVVKLKWFIKTQQHFSCQESWDGRMLLYNKFPNLQNPPGSASSTCCMYFCIFFGHIPEENAHSCFWFQ